MLLYDYISTYHDLKPSPIVLLLSAICKTFGKKEAVFYLF